MWDQDPTGHSVIAVRPAWSQKYPGSQMYGFVIADSGQYHPIGHVWQVH